MNETKNIKKQYSAWAVCPECQGLGKKKRRIRKSIRLHYLKELEAFEKTNPEGAPPVKPVAALYPCPDCNGSGVISAENFPTPDSEKYPHIAIIGGGIGGVALAVALKHRGIPFTLYERDQGFSERSQGYGLTLQQASKAIEGFGITSLDAGVVSTRHLVHTPDGKVVGEWGMRKWLENGTEKNPRRTNIHIARQSLRAALLGQLGGNEAVNWGHQLVGLTQSEDAGVELKFELNEKIIAAKADLVVGADGIRSVVRSLLINDEISPLRYLNCIVILGICPLNRLENTESDLLDSATVFQTANGHERIYVMPYDADSVMWQLSFPMSEDGAKELSAKGSSALKTEAIKRTQWHSPVPQILAATQEALVSGYPVYDRTLLGPEMLEKAGPVTLIGDAAHPMSPFKGQGANQALLDALHLAREIYSKCKTSGDWRATGTRANILETFETEMLARSASKVQDSAAAADFLHSETALYEGDEPRGRVLKRKEN
ncbi:2-polyprenyl-6-methoxyphenol hydroxylase-likeFAD-dependent oxidoreductases [Flavobacteriaceae bacterium 3519-10]|nr:2-polyprenyl-6-methoxyphenol hydroxylase-likeFAD-dependent oxidoreductases [Flavobacteriaceae bacterium 3519-10]